MSPVLGVEPRSQGYKPRILPLNYTGMSKTVHLYKDSKSKRGGKNQLARNAPHNLGGLLIIPLRLLSSFFTNPFRRVAGYNCPRLQKSLLRSKSHRSQKSTPHNNPLYTNESTFTRKWQKNKKYLKKYRNLFCVAKVIGR